MNHLNWSNIKRVARWEFIKTLKTPTFIILTFVVPLIMLVTGMISYWGARIPEGDFLRLAVIDHTDEFYYTLDNYMQSHSAQTDIVLEKYDGGKETLKTAIIEDGEYNGFLEIDEDSVKGGRIAFYLCDLRGASMSLLREHLSISMTTYRLQQQGMVDGDITDAVSPVSLEITPLREEDGFGHIVGPLMVGMILVFSTIFSGQILMHGVIKEKRNRIVEILLSSVSAIDLMVGKIIGYGGLGLLQMVLWVGAGFAVVSRFFDIGVLFPEPADMGIYLLYFVFGYILFASVFAGMGAIMKDAEGGSQIHGLAIIIPMIPIFLASPIFMMPDALWVRLLSHLPPFIPATVLLRMAATVIPTWEILSTSVVLILSVCLFIYIGARIFEGGLLRFDRNASLKEMWQMLMTRNS